MKNYPLLIHNTFGIDVTAAEFLEYDSKKELLDLIGSGKVSSPYLHIGEGSNLLFLDNYKGTILHSRIAGIKVVKEDKDAVELHVGAGITWDNFVDYCVKRRWYGAENLSLIPGEVGAAAVQNIGAYGVEVKDLIRSVETIDIHGRKCIYDVNECHYAYRKSLFKLPEMKSVFVTNVNFRLSTKEHYTLEYGAIREELTKYPSTDLETVRKVIIDIRKRKLPDPKQIGNAGSFFMNPIVSRERFESLKKEYSSMPHYEIDANSVKIPAGWLIEQCGWKGKSMGRAGVYDKQALVLVNLGGATGHEIAALSDAIRESVHVKFGINILPEVNFID